MAERKTTTHHEEEHSLSAEITVLQEISYAIVHKKNVSELLHQILEILSLRLNMIRGTFTTVKNNKLYIEATHDLEEAEKKHISYNLGEGITGHVAECGRPHLIEDIVHDPRFLNRLGARDRVMGANADLQKDLKFLEIVGNIVGEALMAVVAEHEEMQQLLHENKQLRDMLDDTNPPALIGNCKSMREIYDLIKQVAASDATVLLRGSSGTGKEMAARAIVSLSDRKNKPFITLNCAAIPENLVESELFGHEKGAFTGAVARRIGHVEKANTGTLFLDEVGDLSLSSQVKLLRFIQERTFSRLGSSQELKSDIRLIAATSRNLEDMISKGQFREDLYYRLNI